MNALDHLATIDATKSLAVLDGMSKNIWLQWAEGQLSDDQAQEIGAAIEHRKRQVRGLDTVAARAPAVAAAAKAQGRQSYFPPKRKSPMSPDRRASRDRRRLLAASGPMPPALAAHFTTGELAALRIVTDEVRDRGDCRLHIAQIAARAGVGETTTRNALRSASREGFLTIEERRRDKRPNLANVVRIISREWKAWIERGRRVSSSNSCRDQSRGGGFKKAKATDKASFRSTCGDRGNRDQIHQKPEAPPLTRRRRDVVENAAATPPTLLHQTSNLRI